MFRQDSWLAKIEIAKIFVWKHTKLVSSHATRVTRSKWFCNMLPSLSTWPMWFSCHDVHIPPCATSELNSCSRRKGSITINIITVPLLLYTRIGRGRRNFRRHGKSIQFLFFHLARGMRLSTWRYWTRSQFLGDLATAFIGGCRSKNITVYEFHY